MNENTSSKKSAIKSALAATMPHALATSIALNIALGIVVYKIGTIANVRPAAEQSSVRPAVEFPTIERSTEMESCKITITKYRAAAQQGGKIYWGSKVDSCGETVDDAR